MNLFSFVSPKDWRTSTILALVGLPKLAVLPKTSTKNITALEQIDAVKNALTAVGDRIYNTELKNISVAHSSRDITVTCPGVGQKLNPVHLAVVYKQDNLFLPKSDDVLGENNFDTTSERLDQLRQGAKDRILIQSGTLYITGNPKENLKELDTEHKIMVGDIVVAEALYILSSSSPKLYYKIFGDVYMSKMMYREYIVRLPQTIEMALSKMKDHSYVMPSLLEEAEVKVISTASYKTTPETTSNITPLATSEIAAD